MSESVPGSGEPRRVGARGCERCADCSGSTGGESRAVDLVEEGAEQGDAECSADLLKGVVEGGADARAFRRKRVDDLCSDRGKRGAHPAMRMHIPATMTHAEAGQAATMMVPSATVPSPTAIMNRAGMRVLSFAIGPLTAAMTAMPGIRGSPASRGV